MLVLNWLYIDKHHLDLLHHYHRRPASRSIMSLDIRMDQDVQIIKLSGELDSTTVQAIRSQIQQALETPAKLHAVDASNLTMVDSSGIGMLVFMFKQVHTVGTPFALTALSGQPAEMIRFLKIDQKVPVHDDVEQALKALCS
ncbi:MAG: STAS domain-containing protein [Oceanococcus sp.]